MQRTLIHAATLTPFLFASFAICAGAESDAQKAPAPEIELRHQGLHGYIASRCEKSPIEFRYGAGFYSAVWQLVAQPISDFQIGLPSTWILPDNSDNRTEPLCPVGTIPRDSWPERGPTFDSVFQTLEGGLGYWAGNRFHYGPPKFSMNGTPDCYSNEVASPGWSFFYNTRPLPDNRLGIAQISNRLLIPPDGLPFSGAPSGEFLGYAYMALPLTDARPDPQPTGAFSWTLFLNAKNFKGPLAYYLPECWSRISHDYPTDIGRGLDARAASGDVAGSMEINTVPEFLATDKDGLVWTRIPELSFPVDASGRTTLVRDVALYSKAALYDAVLAWRRGGSAPKGAFTSAGTFFPKVVTGPVTYSQDEKPIGGINELVTPTVFEDSSFGLQWTKKQTGNVGRFPAYFRQNGKDRIAVDASAVPANLGLTERQFPKPTTTPEPYSAEPLAGSWAKPGPSAGPFTTKLVDGSLVTYSWYRFIDQPVFGQFAWSVADRAALQSLIERMHREWPIDGEYLAPPRSAIGASARSGGSTGKPMLASFDANLFVTPPKGMEFGYVPIVIRQEFAPTSQKALKK